MAKQNLPQLIEWLSQNPLNRFDIYNVDTEEAIEKCVSYEDLTRDFDTPIGYFENMANNGIKTVQVWKKRKNGSSYVPKGCGLNFAISKKNVAASGGSASPAATPQQNYNPGLMGANTQNHGLGFPEIMAMRSQADRFTDVKELATELKKRNAELEAENKRLERDNMRLENEIEKNAKPSTVDKFLDAFAQNPQAFMAGISSLKSGGNQAGLNSPQVEEKAQLSDAKSMVVDQLALPQITDQHAIGAYHLFSQALSGNQEFVNDYMDLLRKFELVNNGSNGNSNG